MRQLSQDHRYHFRPPQVRSWLRPLLDWANRRIFLRRRYRVATIECRGIEKIVAAVKAGDAVVLAPNHADHADVHVMYEVLRKAGLDPRFMAARELFDTGKLTSFALQSAGVFSVDRDGADIAAIKMALSILEQGRCPLVIYPEGEIYHHHEWLDPLHDGVAAILMRAAKRLPAGKTARLFPLAFHFTWDPAVKATFAPRVADLEERFNRRSQEELPMVERLLQLGAGVLTAKESQYFGESIGGGLELKERITNLWNVLLEDVASRHGCDAKAVTAPERVRSMRARIRRALLDEEHPPDEARRRSLHDDLDRIHVAYQAYSYPGVYLTGHPSDDRIAETLLKLEEDLLGEFVYPVNRTASLVIGDPIDVTAFSQDGAASVMALTGQLEERLAGMLGGLRGVDPDWRERAAPQ